jgi:hypothetical protein
MAITLDGTTGITTPGLTNTGTETLVNLTTTGNTTLGDASTDTLNVGNGGLIKDASGNVGIGNTSPAARIDVFRSTVGTYFLGGGGDNVARQLAIKSSTTTNSGDTHTFDAQSGTGILAFAITGTERARIDSSGNLGIGTTSPSSRLEVVATASTLGQVRIGGSGVGTLFAGMTAGSIGFLHSNTGTLAFGTSTSDNNLVERARIDSSGNLLVGRTTTANTTVGSGLYASGLIASCQSASTNANTAYDLYSTGAAAYRFYVGMGGTVYATITTISAISDIRYKENVRDLDVGLDAVLALKPRLYDWKEGKGADIKNARGFIAQEFEEVFPDLIDEWKDPAPEGEEPYKSVRQDLIPVLVKAIQEQTALITTLTDRITALEAK